jgi:uncharacterized protein (DUF1684 family)
MTTMPIALLLAFALVACASTPGAARPRFDASARDAWHAARIKALTADNGWLTLVGLDFLKDGETTIGSSPECTLRYEHATAARIGVFVKNGERVAFQPAQGADVTLDGARVTNELQLLADDAAALANAAPKMLQNGPLAIMLVRRNGALALRVRDNASPVRTGFHGIPLYPFDPALVIEARVVPAPTGTTIAITNVMGFVEQQPLAATLRFEIAGRACALAATEGGHGGFSLVFGDTTNSAETYGGGRFLEVGAPVGGKAILDFNRAYNPPCCFTHYATCPLPPAENRLDMPIAGGERNPHSAE